MSFEKIKALPFVPTAHRLKLAAAGLGERLRGLDFTVPDRMYDRGRSDGAMYYATPQGILRELFACVDRERFSRFIDVGCGKGFVLAEAKKYGFADVGGVEYDEKLCRIARKNMKRLGLRAEIVCTDAAAFDGYGGYDVFYFFNPFRGELMERAVQRIVQQCRGREIFLVYYRPRYPEAIEQYDFFEKVQVLHDDVKDYMAHVYRGRVPE